MKQLGIQSLQKGCVVLVTFVLLASGCFITDCPRRRGKKDSHSSENALRSHNSQLRQCSLCGPSLGQGNPQSYSPSATFRCFGEDLCCSTNFGCLPPQSAGSSVCSLEAAASVNPCKNHVPSCRSVPDGGQCATDGLCCNSKGACKEDVSCSTSVRRHEKSPPPYHATFSEPVSGRRPDISEIAAEKMAYELAQHTKHNWDGEAHRGGEVTSSGTWKAVPSAQIEDGFPAGSSRGYHTNAFYKKSHPYAVPKAALLRAHYSKPKVDPNDTERSLIRQFEQLANHYNTMKKLISNGVRVSDATDDEDDDVLGSPRKRNPADYKYDPNYRFGMLRTEKKNKLHPWFMDDVYNF